MRGIVRPRRFALAALWLAAAAAPAQARPTAEITAFGRTEGARGAAVPGGGGTGLAPARPRTGVRYLDNADTVEARLCRSFGVTLRITPGPGERVPAAVEVRVLHPAFTGPGGATSREDDFPSAVVFGQTHVGFTFDHDWERQPGEWTVAVSAGGVPLAAKRFHVRLPPPGAPTTDCGGESA